jgi:hypothetical protein
VTSLAPMSGQGKYDTVDGANSQGDGTAVGEQINYSRSVEDFYSDFKKTPSKSLILNS